VSVCVCVCVCVVLCFCFLNFISGDQQMVIVFFSVREVIFSYKRNMMRGFERVLLRLDVICTYQHDVSPSGPCGLRQR
jgi:hypothetical protein